MSKKAYRIGITGGIGSGKSLIANIFKVFGIPVYDADLRAKWIINNDHLLKKQIIGYFGKEAYKDDKFNSKFIAEIVFNNPEQLKSLNKLVHPLVGEDYDNWVKSHSGAPYTLKEAALLFESGSAENLDKVINITAPKNIRIIRVLLRDTHRSKGQVEDIIAQQLSDNERKIKADYNINNDGNALLIPQALKIHYDILGLSIK